MGAPELRLYLRELRTGQRISQKDLAAAMGVAVRTLITWELGATDDLKSTSMARALKALGGSIEDAYHLLLSDTASALEARHLAQIRLFTPSTVPLTEQPHGPVPITVVTPYAAPLEDILQHINVPFPLRSGHRMYEGVRPANSSTPAYILVNGEPFETVYHTAFGYASGGLEWGYSGHGPAQLARALVNYECMLPAYQTLDQPAHAMLRRSISAIQRATQRFTMSLPRTGEGIQWTLDSAQFALWVKAITVFVHALPANQTLDFL